jgi:phosphoserine phosphatase RsbU/P
MHSVSMAKLLKPKGPLRPILDALLDSSAAPVGIWDLEGNLLAGRGHHGPDHPIAGEQVCVTLEGQTIGWVRSAGASGGTALGLNVIADLLAYAAEQENEKKSMASELLERYREINLLYHLSEQLASTPSPQMISGVALEEAIRLISVETGIILLEGKDRKYQKIAERGQAHTLCSSCGMVERVLKTGRAELSNQALADDFFENGGGQRVSVLAAPLKTEKNILGIILLFDQPGRVFVASDLKLINAIALQAAPAIEISRLYQIEVESIRMEKDLEMARQVQESLLPAELPNLQGWKFSHRWRPAHNVSGDFYDIIRESRQRMGLVIADITDKGMAASLFMVFVRSALRATITRTSSPTSSVTRANQTICKDSNQGLFATLVYARLDTESGEVTYTNAGHNPPILYRSEQQDLVLLKRTGLPLGVDMNSIYSHLTVVLEPGDFILFYTDGITEAINPLGVEYGLDRLKQELYGLRTRPVDEILDGLEASLARHIDGAEALDDVTFLLAKRLPTQPGPSDAGWVI